MRAMEPHQATFATGTFAEMCMQTEREKGQRCQFFTLVTEPTDQKLSNLLWRAFSKNAGQEGSSATGLSK